MIKQNNKYLYSLLLSFFLSSLLFWGGMTSAYAGETISLSVSDEVDVDINIYPAKGDKVILWLACNEGHEGPEAKASKHLVKQGIEIWFPDFLSAHFLPQGPSSIYKITGEEVAAVIREISKRRPGKSIYLVAGGRANAPLIRGAVEWEKQSENNAIKAAILLYPRLNLLEPVPGNEPVYIEAVGKVKLPIVILEGERTPNRWGLPHLSSKFKESSVSVRYELLPKVRGYFYTRPKKTAAEKALSEKLHEIVYKQIVKLEGK
ncbi:MAG: hypothetical protein KAQ67_11635 [Gammaproteobacteria bacterium]|nr:hypothetical protein [Gammaproteobacteria bacterium]